MSLTLFIFVASMAGAVGIKMTACCVAVVIADAAKSRFVMNMHTVIRKISEATYFSCEHQIALVILE